MEFLNFSFSAGRETYTGVGDLPEDSFRGVGSVFGGVVDAYVPTIIHRGAFTKTLEEGRRKVVVLWNHEDSQPIGTPTRLFEMDDGLFLEAKISRTRQGQDVLTLLRDGVLDALSIGFDPIKEDFESFPDGSMVRHVREVRLWEVSVVPWGADANARIREVNSALTDKFGPCIGTIQRTEVFGFEDIPVSDEDTDWDCSGATERLNEMFQGKRPKGFVLPQLPIADVVGGKLRVVPKAVFSAEARLLGAHGSQNISSDELTKALAALKGYFEKLHVVPVSAGGDIVRERYSDREYAFLIGKRISELASADKAAEALAHLKPAEPPQALTVEGVDVESILRDAELSFFSNLL